MIGRGGFAVVDEWLGRGWLARAVLAGLVAGLVVAGLVWGRRAAGALEGLMFFCVFGLVPLWRALGGWAAAAKVTRKIVKPATLAAGVGGGR